MSSAFSVGGVSCHDEPPTLATSIRSFSRDGYTPEARSSGHHRYMIALRSYHEQVAWGYLGQRAVN